MGSIWTLIYLQTSQPGNIPLGQEHLATFPSPPMPVKIKTPPHISPVYINSVNYRFFLLRYVYIYINMYIRFVILDSLNNWPITNRLISVRERGTFTAVDN